MSADRKAHIKASLAWQQFSRDADEVSDIILHIQYMCVLAYTYMYIHTYLPYLCMYICMYVLTYKLN